MNVAGSAYDRFMREAPACSIAEPRLVTIALVGASCSGKSAYVERLVSGAFVEPYEQTPGVRIRALTWLVRSRGVERELSIALADCGGHPVYAACVKQSLLTTDVALVFTNDDDSATRGWLARCDELRVPTILCASRQDKRKSRGAQRLSKLLWEERAATEPPRLGFEISSRSCYNLEKPVLWALRRCFGDAELSLVTVERLPEHQS
jgi:GTPase SAR1 family protein